MEEYAKPLAYAATVREALVTLRSSRIERASNELLQVMRAVVNLRSVIDLFDEVEILPSVDARIAIVSDVAEQVGTGRVRSNEKYPGGEDRRTIVRRSLATALIAVEQMIEAMNDADMRQTQKARLGVD